VLVPAEKYVKCNHYPGSIRLGRKDLLWQAYASKKKEFPQDFDYMPETWLLPDDYNTFIKKREVILHN
jgi:hypothetical protein